MKKYTLFLIPFILLLIYLYSTMIVRAQDGCNGGIISTSTGNQQLNSEMHQATLTIVSSGTTISAEEPITLRVDSGGQACPSFSWQVSGTGYHLDKSETYEDLEVVTLTCDPGT